VIERDYIVLLMEGVVVLLVLVVVMVVTPVIGAREMRDIQGIEAVGIHMYIYVYK
jgi:hypothetical protein